MPLPLITANMRFDIILRAIEAVLFAESENQKKLGGYGWHTVRERFDPWSLTFDKFNPGAVNVSWSSSNYPEAESDHFEMVSNSEFSVDCYASEKAFEIVGTVFPKDQRTADILHALISKVFYTLMSPINIDLGFAPGYVIRPFVTSVNKFIPTQSGVPVQGVLAARFAYRIKHLEIPPEAAGVSLNYINVKSNREDGVLYVEQDFDYTT